MGLLSLLEWDAMMTDDEIHAWDNVTDEAAQHLVDTVTQAAGETLLRGALRKLMGKDGGNERYRDALIYQAMMAARDAGMYAGIRLTYKGQSFKQPVAVIHLPTGAIGFSLPTDIGMTELAMDDANGDVIRRYIGE